MRVALDPHAWAWPGTVVGQTVIEGVVTASFVTVKVKGQGPGQR